MKIILFSAWFAMMGASAVASVYPKPSLQTEAAGKKKFIYYGGPVIAHARVMTVFWGKNVNAKVKDVMPKFYAGVVDSTYMDWLGQYNTNINAQDGRMGTNQAIGRGTYGGTFTIEPAIQSGTLSDDQIQKELALQIKSGKLPPATDDTLYMLHFPAGLKITIPDGNGGTAASCQQFCAYHFGFKSAQGGNVFYGVMPDLSSMACSMGCGMGASLVDRTTISSSHELIEAVTDGFPTPGSNPSFPQAWNTIDGLEIGDVCQSNLGKLKVGALSFALQQEFDNEKGACTTGDYISSASF